MLAFLGQFDGQHVHWEVVLGLSLVELGLIDVVAGDLAPMSSQQNQWVVLDAEGTNVMTALLAETSLVFVLKMEKTNYLMNPLMYLGHLLYMK